MELLDPRRERTFDEAAEDFLRYKALYARDQETARHQVNILLRYFRGRILSSIRKRDIEAMIAARRADGIARSTTNRQVAALSKIFSLSIADEDYEGFGGPNPCRAVRKFPEPAGRVRWLLHGEQVHLVKSAPGHIRWPLLFSLHTGGRLGEVLALRRRDLELFPRAIEVDNGKLSYGWVHYRASTTKSGKDRQVPISEDLVVPVSLILAEPGEPDDRIFTWRGRPLKSVRTAFENARKAAGFGRDVVWHTTRHTFAAIFMQNGGDLYVLKDLMGHSTITVTEKYAHLSPKYLNQAAAFIGARPTDTEDRSGAEEENHSDH